MYDIMYIGSSLKITILERMAIKDGTWWIADKSFEIYNPDSSITIKL